MAALLTSTTLPVLKSTGQSVVSCDGSCNYSFYKQELLKWGYVWLLAYFVVICKCNNKILRYCRHSFEQLLAWLQIPLFVKGSLVFFDKVSEIWVVPLIRKYLFNSYNIFFQYTSYTLFYLQFRPWTFKFQGSKT